tara:strand:- start:65 stop:349 length:285 start_codon:yes stop_codon:yes gene_type:complete
MKKKKYTKFRTLFKSANQREVDKFMDNLKDKEGISVYRRDFQDKDKTRFYVRKIVRQGTKVALLALAMTNLSCQIAVPIEEPFAVAETEDAKSL